MKKGKSWFTDREECKQEGKSDSASYTTFDGPGCPTALLSVETIRPCFVHDPVQDLIAFPCLCVTPTIPEHLKDKSELHIEGLTVIKTPVKDFSSCPKYEYVITESGEVFTNHEKDI